jgi:hypothetical protein
MEPKLVFVVVDEKVGTEGISNEYVWAEVGSLMMFAVLASGTTTPAFGTA